MENILEIKRRENKQIKPIQLTKIYREKIPSLIQRISTLVFRRIT